MTLLLTSCAKTPDNLKVNSEQNDITVKDNYVTCDELKQELKDENIVYKTSFDNMKIADGIRVSAPDNIYNLSFTQCENQEKYFDSISSVLIDKQRLNTKWEKELTTTESPNNYTYQSDSNDFSETFVLGVNGYLYYDYYDNVIPTAEDESPFCTTFVNSTDKDKIITFESGEQKLSDTVKIVENKLDELTNAMDSQLAFKIKYAKIYKTNSNKELVKLYGSLSYDKVFVSSVIDYSEKIDFTPAPSWVEVTISDLDKISGINTNSGTLVINDKSVCDKVMSFETAISQAADYLAPYNDFTLIGVDFEYYTKLEKIKLDGVEENFSYQAGCEYSAEPCWAFYFNVDSDTEQVLYINAQTGEEYMLANNLVVTY